MAKRKKDSDDATRFAWRRGYHSAADPQAVGERVQRIKQRNGGRVGAADLVEDARLDRGSPLRLCFEWRNQEAAEQWRLHQARNVMGALYVVQIGTSQLEHPTRYLVTMGPARNVPEQVERPYIGIEDVRANPHYRARVLANFLDQIEALEQDYDDILSYLGVDFTGTKERIADALAEARAERPS